MTTVENTGYEVTEIKIVRNVKEYAADGKSYSFSQAHMTLDLPPNCTVDQAISILKVVKNWPGTTGKRK